MWRREQQCDNDAPYQATVAEDMAPKQPSVWVLLGSIDKDILGMAEDIYCGQYQLAPSIIMCQHLDLLMQELQDKLDPASKGWPLQYYMLRQVPT